MRRDDTFIPKVFAICGIIVIGFVIYAIVTAFKGDEVKFDGKGASETFSVEGLALVPGEEKAYTYTLNCKEAGEYGVALEIKEMKDGGLKRFVDVEVKLGEKVVFRDKLSNMMNRSEILLTEHRFGRDKVELTVTYSMPYDVGNEAMKTYSDFDLTLILSEKGEKSDG